MANSEGWVVGQVYRRRTLHESLGGQQQGGICTPSSHPLILIFTGESGAHYGYHDGIQSDGTFWYTGEGQVGDMQWVRGNRAIREHEADGKALHLFEQAERGFVRYVGQLEYLGFHTATAPDRTETPRSVIVFELGFVSEDSHGLATPVSDSAVTQKALSKRSLADLRNLALAGAHMGASASERRAVVHLRSEAIKCYVRKRANGCCEACGLPAPFITAAGEPFLEPHHVRRLADGGPDHPRWVAAICPNCHRQVHYGKDGEGLNSRIESYLQTIEPSDEKSA